MKTISIFDITTGQIQRIVECPDEQVDDQYDFLIESYKEGVYDDENQLIFLTGSHAPGQEFDVQDQPKNPATIDIEGEFTLVANGTSFLTILNIPTDSIVTDIHMPTLDHYGLPYTGTTTNFSTTKIGEHQIEIVSPLHKTGILTINATAP